MNKPYHPMHDNITHIYINDERSIPRYVVCAANRRESDGLIICGARHWDKIMHAVADALPDRTDKWEQGFIDQYGFFLTRKEARYIVEKNKQALRDYGLLDDLYSENLY